MSKDYLQILPPDGFRFKPARGKVEADGSVTVSGCNMTERDIDSGVVLAELDSLFSEIDGS